VEAWWEAKESRVSDQLDTLRWHRSSHPCGTGQCLECAVSGGVVHVRDASDDTLRLPLRAWKDFVAGVKAGEFDTP
jgi:hypothetical protein